MILFNLIIIFLVIFFLHIYGMFSCGQMTDIKWPTHFDDVSVLYKDFKKNIHWILYHLTLTRKSTHHEMLEDWVRKWKIWKQSFSRMTFSKEWTNGSRSRRQKCGHNFCCDFFEFLKMYLQERRDILIKYQLKDGGNCPDSDESDVKKREEVYILLNRDGSDEEILEWKVQGRKGIYSWIRNLFPFFNQL